jgi:hypothetical protein
MNRDRAKLFERDGNDPLLKVKQAKPNMKLPPYDDAKVREIAQETGFSSRADPDSSRQSVGAGTFDARSLRKSGRSSQLNIAIKPSTKDRFWRYAVAKGFTTGEDTLLALLDAAGS